MPARSVYPLSDHVFAIDERLKMAPGLMLSIRTTVLRDSDGSLTLVSPVQGVDTWGPQVAQLGRVARIVAPNAYHHLFALPALAFFPEAQLVASAPLRRKRKDFPPQTQWLQGPGPVDLTPELQLHRVDGMRSEEWVLLHRPSRTLVVTDLMFHDLNPDFAMGLISRLTGTHKKLAVSRIFLRDRTDRGAYAASVAAIAELDFDALVVAHGEPIPAGAKPLVHQALHRSV